MPTAPFVSVIVPVYNDAAKLRLCLDALERQTYAPEAYEVVVVDNASAEDISSVVRDYAHAVYARESTPGSYAARNHGLELARGDFLAFTDSDCIPRPDWLEGGARALLSAPDCGLVGGEIVLSFKDPERPTLAELHESVYGFNQKREVEGQNYSVTANLFTFRRRFDEVGPFDHSLKSGGDREWSQRVLRAGYPLVYAADVVIAHPARASFKDMVARERRFTGYTYKEMMEKGTAKGFARELAKRLYQVPRAALKSYSRRDLELDQAQRAKVAFMVAVKRLVQVGELARLRLGGEARR